jgi:hypothetical protein
MADAPWQCLQCGTVNEPSANSCRSCGRWPSLFDLERGAVAATTVEETWSRRPVEVDELHPEISVMQEYEIEPVAQEAVSAEPSFEPAEEPEQGRRGKLLRSLIVPIAFAVYLIISIVLGDRGSS